MAEQVLEIPLFPLSMVLFPGMVQPLHIFEPRYCEMTKHSLDGDGQFGVTLALPESVFQREVPARAGSIARILDYQRLPDGRYNLLTAGQRRFEVLETFRDKSYLRGRVRLLPEELGAGPVERLANEARRLLDEYLAAVLSDLENGGKQLAIPLDPIELSYFIAVLLPCEDCGKQELLEAPAAVDRLARELDLLREETARAREEAAADRASRHSAAPGPDDHSPARQRHRA